MGSYYGNYNEDAYPLAAHIWGHRLRTGQHWIEYMLEFLSVLSGFDYQLGRGISANAPDTYRLPKRLGLRRFIFYDQHEKNRSPDDDAAVQSLYKKLHSRIVDNSTDGNTIKQLRSLLRSFSVVETNRSWYAKCLLPVHEEFLLWEGQRRRSSVKRSARPVTSEIDTDELDRDIEFTTRNFFARGGEIYYLIVSAGTEGRPEQRSWIGQRLRNLLTENQSLGRLARIVDTTWNPRDNGHADSAFLTGSLGWIPQAGRQFYQQIADDLATFLDNDLDSLECLELLAHLIAFHIISYIYFHANPTAERPALLIDLLGEQDGGVLRNQSAKLLREQEDRQLRRAREFVTERVREWVSRQPRDQMILDYLISETEKIFELGHARAKETFQRSLGKLSQTYAKDCDRLVQEYSEILFENLEREFRKNFLGVHRKLGRAIGLIAPATGPRPRFVLGDNLLKTLVLANLKPGDTMSFGDFLERLYQRYGIIIGPGEARTARLIEQLRINEEYYSHNRDVLRKRMRRAGLLVEYSDMTALVRRRP